MSVTVTNSRVVPVDTPTVFAYMDDYRNIADWLFGIKKFEPVTAQLNGVGATYDVTVSLGVPINVRVECIEWEQDRLIELTSVKGLSSTSKWTFEPVGGGTRVTGEVSYDLPFGPAGKALGKTLEPFVKIATDRTTDDLEQRLRALGEQS